jgi:hypothetical protein
MKSTFILLVTFIVIIVKTSAQTAGDYRSIGSGNWNDASKWETYDGSNWVGTNAYPGQNPGAGIVTVSNQTEITITTSVPRPISSLSVSDDSGKLIFSSENPLSLSVSGDVSIYGSMVVADQNGTKNHSLIIGGSLVAGKLAVYEEFEGCDYGCLIYYCYYPLGGDIQTISNDDALEVILNTTKPNSSIGGTRAITFQDISFNGIGISVATSIYINGIARFISGLVNSGSGYAVPYCDYYWTPDTLPPPPVGCCGVISFNDGATAVGASVNSFVNGYVTKQGNDSFTFPIGYKDEGASVPLTVYAPLTISAPVGVQDVFIASYSRGGLTPEISDAGLYNVSNCEYWYLYPGYQSNNVTSSIDLTVGWNSSSGCGSSYVTNVPEVTVAHFNGTSWDSHGGSGVGTTTNGSVTWSGVSDFGIFSLGNLNTSCVPPSELYVTNITSNSASLSWSAVPGAVSYDVGYKPAPFCCWTNTTSTSFNLSGLTPLATYNWEVRANCGSSSSPARLGPQFTTQSPCGTPSGLSATNITTNSATLSWGTVSNANSYNVQYKQSTSANWIPVATGIPSPSYILSALAAATSYDWRVSANCNEGTGLYAQASFVTAPPVCNDVYEPNDESGQARSITFGTTISAGISSTNDVDWFKVTMPNNPNTPLLVTLINLPADYDLYVYNKNLMQVGSSANMGTSNETVSYYSHARSATYYIKVIGKNDAYNVGQCYNLLAQAIVGGGPVARSTNPANEITDNSDNQLLYPNPASEFVQLTFSSTVEGRYDVQIVNTVGQLVKQYPVNITKGYNQVKIPVKDVRAGMYILKINKDGLNLIKRFVIAR